MSDYHEHRYTVRAPVFASMLGGYGVRYDCDCGAVMTGDGISNLARVGITYDEVAEDVHRRVLVGYARRAATQAMRRYILARVAS